MTVRRNDLLATCKLIPLTDNLTLKWESHERAANAVVNLQLSLQMSPSGREGRGGTQILHVFCVASQFRRTCRKLVILVAFSPSPLKSAEELKGQK